MPEINDVESYRERKSELEELKNLNLPIREKYIALKYILERSCYELTQNEPVQFPSFFARLVFLAQKYDLAKPIEKQLHRLRVKARFLQKDDRNLLSQKDWDVAFISLKDFFGTIYLNRKVENEEEPVVTEDSGAFPDYLRVQVVKNDTENHLLICVADTETFQELEISYEVKDWNDIFTPSVSRFWVGAQVNLIAPRKDSRSGKIVPQGFVLEPDYLLDVSAMAECFPGFDANYLHYFRRKFEQRPNTHYILLGNLANFFLDELIFAKDLNRVTFKDTFFKAFKQMPFEFTSCEAIAHREDFLAFMAKAETQFVNIKRVIGEDFPKAEIDAEKCTLEPSFFCEKYGFQGRLDLFQKAENEHELHHIIELKSGGLPFPSTDHARVSPNHEVQTLIYRMIIETVFGTDNRKIFPAILYSAADISGTNLRLAAPSMKMEKQILELRNQILIMEHAMYLTGEAGVSEYLDKWLNISNYVNPPRFLEEQIDGFRRIFEQISPLEMAYFVRFVSFISRELYIQKSGDLGPDTKPGISDLWKSDFNVRKNNFDLIYGLTIDKIEDYERGMVIHFSKSEAQPFVNFREGDICIVYPHERETDSVLSSQILKGTIAEINSKSVVVRFRYKQRNDSYFTENKLWAIEHDVMDHSYNQMFGNLVSFLKAPEEKRKLLLGLTESKSVYEEKKLTTSKEGCRNRIIEKAIAADDYFLVVGPPGTGKTSIFARTIIEKYFAKPDVNILVMAYTNRAVDELCESVEAATGSAENYIRIGSELSCGVPYRERLLQKMAEKVGSRNELLQILQSKRIYIGTLAAILGKPEIFSMKKFQIAVVDEASQILEPQIIGLLPNFDKFILIGDHKQLSTITLQEPSQSKVTNLDLNEIELMDCRDSYFERLFRICQRNGWTNAYDTLIYQGRMHEELSGFVNENFYENQLLPASDWQKEKQVLQMLNAESKFQQLIVSKQVAFIHSPQIYDLVSSGKVNEQEAEIVAFLSKALLEVYRASGIEFNPQKSLGIIAPYRNQIAMIRHKLEMLGIPALNEVMVDTVERFQGSQRDVIVLSFCMNKPRQLQFFCNMNTEKTVDRKLNVALTRARKQLYLVGNRDVLSQHPLYEKLISWAEKQVE